MRETKLRHTHWHAELHDTDNRWYCVCGYQMPPNTAFDDAIAVDLNEYDGALQRKARKRRKA